MLYTVFLPSIQISLIKLTNSVCLCVCLCISCHLSERTHDICLREWLILLNIMIFLLDLFYYKW